MSKTAEVQGVYFEDLQKFGLPNFVYLDDKLVIVKSIIWKKSSGRGITKQCFYVLIDGRIKHPNQVKKLNKQQIKSLQRDLILNEILNDKSK